MERELKHLQRLRPARRATGTAIAFCVPLIVGWYAGYDMLERGGVQAACLAYAFALAVATWTCPFWKSEPRNG